jgi:predicted TIM-barrel fold metal-dependent hydrolase
VVVDTSGGDPETWLVEFAVRELGLERVVFGSDAPGRAFGVQLGKVTGAALTKREKEMILYKNMERILKLK